jgi:hypothetical protein
LSLSDLITALKIVSTILSESLSLSDSRIMLVGKIMSENMLISDGDFYNFKRLFSENFSVSGELTKSEQREISESMAISAIKYFLIGKNLVESANISDEITKAGTRSLTESLTISDDEINSMQRTLNEEYKLSSSMSKQIQRIINEEYSLADSIKKIKEMVREFSENYALSESIFKSTSRTIEEDISIGEILSRSWNINRTYSEIMTLTDLKGFARIKELLESLSLSDGDAIMNFVKMLSERFLFSDLMYTSTSVLPNDFLTGPLADLGETVTRIPGTLTTDFHGNRSINYGAEQEMEAVFMNPNQDFSLDNSGLAEVADLVMYIGINVEISKYDKIIYDGKFYRVDDIGDRTDNGITVFKPVNLHYIEDDS